MITPQGSMPLNAFLDAVFFTPVFYLVQLLPALAVLALYAAAVVALRRLELRSK